MKKEGREEQGNKVLLRKEVMWDGREEREGQKRRPGEVEGVTGCEMTAVGL